MKILLCMISFVLCSDTEELTLQSPITIQNVTCSIKSFMHLNHKIDKDIQCEMRKYLRLFNYIPHSYTPTLEENKNFIMSDSCRKMLNGGMHVILKTHPLAHHNSIICVITGLNKENARSDAFKTLWFDLNNKINKEELKKIIFDQSIG